MGSVQFRAKAAAMKAKRASLQLATPTVNPIQRTVTVTATVLPTSTAEAVIGDEVNGVFDDRLVFPSLYRDS